MTGRRPLYVAGALVAVAAVAVAYTELFNYVARNSDCACDGAPYYRLFAYPSLAAAVLGYAAVARRKPGGGAWLLLAVVVLVAGFFFAAARGFA